MNESINRFIKKYNAVKQKDTKLMLDIFGKFYGQTNMLFYGDYCYDRKQYGIPQLDSDANLKTEQWNRETTVKLHKISTLYPEETICCYYCDHKSGGDKKITILCMIENNIYKEYIKSEDQRWRSLGKPQIMDSISFVEWYNFK